MAKVTGIGGIFFKTADPSALLAWYEQHLGVTRSFPSGVKFKWHNPEASSPGASSAGSTVWSLFERDTKYFGPGEQSFMINYRVDDLDALLDKLRAAGVAIDEKREDSDFGRFAWITDPAGNRVELWQPAPGR